MAVTAQAQNFDNILEPNIQSHIRTRLAGITDGLFGTCRRLNHQNGNLITTYNLLSPIQANRKIGRMMDTPIGETDLQQRIIRPCAFHSSVAVDWEDINKLKQDPHSSLAEALVMGLREAMEKHLIEQAFGENEIGPVDHVGKVGFDSTMVIKVDERVNKANSTGSNILDKIVRAGMKLKSNGVPSTAKKYLAITPKAYEKMFFELRMTSRDFVGRENLEQGDISKYFGLDFIVTDYLSGGEKCPTLYDSKTGKPTEEASIIIPKKTPEVKSYALFWAENGLDSALWENVNVKIRELPLHSMAQLLYAECQYGATRTEEKQVGYIEMED